MKQNKSEYLKKYLPSVDLANDSEGKGKKSKKQLRKRSKNNARLKIIDSDASVPLPADFKESEEQAEDDEEITQMVIELTDDVRTDELKMIGKFKTDSWKNVSESPPRRRQRHDSGSSSEDQKRDFSPPRGRQRQRNDFSSSSDLSPAGRANSDSDLSPARLSTKRTDTPDRDLSPPRGRKQSSDQDFSPKKDRKNPQELKLKNVCHECKETYHISPPRRNDGFYKRRSATPEIVIGASGREQKVGKKKVKTLSGKSAGLQSAKSLREESEQHRETEQRMFDLIDDSISGKNAGTVLRERGTGKRRDLKKEQKLTEEQLKKQQELEAKYKLWNKGVKQTTERQERLEEMVREAAKPLARYKDDKDLEEHLKQQDMKEDPMLEYIQKKRINVAKKAGVAQYPKYTGPQPPPNRFGILPGYRWDGVDRSNGFEKKLVTTANLKGADEEEMYKWTMGNYE